MASMKKTRIRSGAELRRRLSEYVESCRADKRVPNVAGFCRFCMISREGYYALREQFPLEFDIAESTFIDEAVNNKLVNTGTSLSFLLSEINRTGLEPERSFETICEHDAYEDGQ